MRKIIHFDIDAFFASVEQRDKPYLLNKPVIICHFNNGRGVVSTASYEARKYGVRSAMPTFQAKKLCPRGFYIAPDFEKYQTISSQIYDIYYQFTDNIESAGLDEAYLDVTTNKKGLPSAIWVAQDIRYRVFKETGLTISAGVSYNKLLSKIASDFQKPNGLTIIRQKEAMPFLKKLPVRKIPGIGPKTESICNSLNIKTIGDFLKFTPENLSTLLGNSGSYYHLAAQGIDERPLEINNKPKSFSVEDTLNYDIIGVQAILPVLSDLAKRLERRLTEDNYIGKTITLKIKYEDHSQITRRQTLDHHTNNWETIFDTARELLSRTQINITPVRLVGLNVSQLCDGDDYEQIGRAHV